MNNSSDYPNIDKPNTLAYPKDKSQSVTTILVVLDAPFILHSSYSVQQCEVNTVNWAKTIPQLMKIWWALLHPK